jgi:uracil-DNA glycosylase
MSTPFCPGYGEEPFRGLVEDCPDSTAYPPDAFRVEWGPVFHRGRLDGTARLLVLGQDPAQHETISRRILMGTAGRRVQGFLGKLGLAQGYVMINTFAYCVYNQAAAARHVDDAAIADYRGRWLSALLEGSPVAAVVAFGSLADRAWHKWLKTPTGAAHAAIAYRKLAHPTSPEAAGGDVAAATKKMLQAWNEGLQFLATKVTPEVAIPLVPYGDAFAADDQPPIPQRDLAAGSPPWMGTKDSWAVREGTSAADKRLHILVTASA